MNTNFHRSGCGSTPQLASKSAKSTNVLHDCGDDVNTADERDNPPLHDAVIKQDIQKCQDLLKHPNIDVNSKNLCGETPLCLSLQRCQYDTSIITQLLEAGCDLNLLSADGEAPLHIAMRRNRTDLAHQLLQKGADLNVLNQVNNSLLDIAVIKNNMEGLCMLLYYGASLNSAVKETTRLLVYVIYVKRDNIARVLFNFYDAFSCTTCLGNTVLHLAASAISPLALDLVKAGADVNCVSNYGETPLLLSLRYEDSELFKLIWPKVDCDILLGCREPFLYTYLQSARFPLTEFLECLHLLLDCPKAYELLGELIASSSFHELINSFYRFSIEPNERLALINICLSLGFKANISDINHVFQLYGFGDELEAFIYSFDNDVTIIPVHFASPLLDLMLPMEKYPEINCLRVNRDILHTLIGTRETFNAFKYFSMSSNQKNRWTSYLSDVPAIYEFHQKLLAVPEFPSLLELSRNKVYNFIRNTNEFTQPYQFHDFVKSLKIPRCIQDIVRFKRPIYE